jgi:hypothetical protein
MVVSLDVHLYKNEVVYMHKGANLDSTLKRPRNNNERKRGRFTIIKLNYH